jgi:hypothetical protein
VLPKARLLASHGRGQYKSSDAAVMTMRELEAWLLVQTVGVYHASPHRGLG